MSTERIIPHTSLQQHKPKTELMKLTRRQLLSRTLAVSSSLMLGGSFITASDAAWAMELKVLKPETMTTLIQMARDIYPHDNFGDDLYAAAVKGHDDKAAEDTEFRTLIDDGVASLDMAAVDAGHANYLATGWESERVALLRSIESGDFFKTIRGGLVVGLYNQATVWEKLGYEGSSFEKGGYLYRGFDDIKWL